MGVSHVIQILQMVPNGTTHHSVPLKAKYKNKLKKHEMYLLKLPISRLLKIEKIRFKLGPKSIFSYLISLLHQQNCGFQ